MRSYGDYLELDTSGDDVAIVGRESSVPCGELGLGDNARGIERAMFLVREKGFDDT
jgi:hypothetical protein